MNLGLRVLAAAAAVLAAMASIGPACAQKSGGVLRLHALDSPPSLSGNRQDPTSTASNGQ